MRALLTLTAVSLLIASSAGAADTTDPSHADLVNPAAEDLCGGAVPCGPIPVVISMKLDADTRELSFAEKDEIVLEGTLTYYFDVDQDGYGFDPQAKPHVTFKTPRTVEWITVSVEPSEIPIPVDDPRYIKQASPQNQPEQLVYEYTHAITVTLTKDADPTADQLKDALRSDGKYRVLLAASSNASLVDLAGTPYGLIEGYGVREMRFTPTGDDGSGALEEDGGNAPGLGILPGLAALLVVVVALRRRS